MKIFPGVHQFKVPLPDSTLEYINSYLVRGDRNSLLIDTGWDAPGAFDDLRQQFAADGVTMEEISQVLITHAHPDHYGLAGRFKQLTDAKVMVHEVEVEQIVSQYIGLDIFLTSMESWLAENGVEKGDLPKLPKASLPAKKFVVPTSIDAAVHDGDVISVGYFNLKVFWTPGHSPGHVCLHEPAKKLLFTGDHILPDISPHVGSNPHSSDSPLSDFLTSLLKLRDLDVDLILPAHGRVFTNLTARVEELLHHHEEREQDILRILDDNPKTAYDVATRITWMKDHGGRPYSQLPSLDKRLAIMEAVSHLRLLLDKGKVRRLHDNGLITYTGSGN